MWTYQALGGPGPVRHCCMQCSAHAINNTVATTGMTEGDSYFVLSLLQDAVPDRGFPVIHLNPQHIWSVTKQGTGWWAICAIPGYAS